MKNQPLHLPALRCRMGDWVYYLTSMRLQEVSDRIRPVTDMHTSASLNELLQREITDRKKDIAQYLIQHRQRFFNSIVVGVYGGSPQWIDIAIDTAKITSEEISEQDTKHINDALGLLHLSGLELLFAIDGQHRVEGIREALNTSGDLVGEDIGVIFVAHKRDHEGLVRTRRLFSTLNRYAKPVSLGEIVALDEDDAFAIVTRQLMDEHPLLRDDRARAHKQVAIPSGDRQSFTTMLTVYKIGIILCDNLRPEWKKKELMAERPSDDTLSQIYAQCAEFWTLMSATFSEVAQSRKDVIAAVDTYRRISGGHMLYRPAGQMAFARAVRLLTDQGVNIASAFEVLARLPYELSASPWIGILWNPAALRMLASVANQEIAADLLVYYAGYLEGEKVLQEYRNVLADQDAELPQLKGGNK